MKNLLASDLDEILTQTQGVWRELDGAHVFVTGGTGFFGAWLLESFAWAAEQGGLKAEMSVLTRSPARFAAKAPHLASHPRIKLLEGDIRTFEFPNGACSHVIHAATEASATLNATEPGLMLDVIVRGTRRVLDYAESCRAARLLFTSSGAVYGKQPADITHLPETYNGAPDPTDPRSAYGEGKRVAELMASISGIHSVIARAFAFVGPHLPTDGTFAVGNFLRDGLSGGPIRVAGDGTPRRSYLYASELAIWLWTLLVQGEAGRAYNVGSDEDLSIGDLAHAVAESTGAQKVEFGRVPTPGAPVERYVPSVDRIRIELGLKQQIALPAALERTAAWLRASQPEAALR